MTSMAVRIWYAVFGFLLHSGVGGGIGMKKRVHASCGRVMKSWTVTCSDLEPCRCGRMCFLMYNSSVIQMYNVHCRHDDDDDAAAGDADSCFQLGSFVDLERRWYGV